MGKMHMHTKLSKDNETLNKFVVISICTLFMFIVFNTGCFVISDWEYEYYYYIEIQSNSTNNYSVCVPLPDASYYRIEEQKYLDNYVENLKVKNGVCTYVVLEHKSEMYIQINGSSSISMSSSFTLSDAYANVSIDKEKGACRTLIYSDSLNISLIIDSRAVRKTNEKNTWDLYYSAAINPDLDFPIPTKNTWKNHLSDEYFFTPQEGWQTYSIQEDTNWNNKLIR